MPTQIDDDELDGVLATAGEIDSYDYRNPDDVDDYLSATLHSTPDGRHFRYVINSGMDSVFAGAGNFGEWLSPAELAKWSEF
jgi:hypothetical protein